MVENAPQTNPVTPEKNETKTVSKKERIFWSKAEKCRIGNFVKEERSGGRVTRAEQPIPFDKHIYVTGKQDEIDFILNSTTLAQGDCREVESIKEAHMLTAQQNQIRGVKDITTTSIESTILSEDGVVVEAKEQNDIR